MFTLYNRVDELENVADQSVTLVMSAGDLRPMWDHIERVLRPEGAIVVFGTKEHCMAHRLHAPLKYRYEMPMNTCDWLSYGKYNRAFIFRMLDGMEGIERRIFNPIVLHMYITNTEFTMEKFLNITYTNPNDIVLDPYGDWGTFLPSMNMDRHYIGVQEDFGVLEDMHYYNDI